MGPSARLRGDAVADAAATRHPGRLCDRHGPAGIDPRYFRPIEVETLLGDSSKAHEKLGWTPITLNMSDQASRQVLFLLSAQLLVHLRARRTQ